MCVRIRFFRLIRGRVGHITTFATSASEWILQGSSVLTEGGDASVSKRERERSPPQDLDGLRTQEGRTSTPGPSTSMADPLGAAQPVVNKPAVIRRNTDWRSQCIRACPHQFRLLGARKTAKCAQDREKRSRRALVLVLRFLLARSAGGVRYKPCSMKKVRKVFT